MCEQTDSRLFGRLVDAPLSSQGELQATAVARRLSSLEQVHVESSPRLRTRQTATAIAEACGRKDVAIAAALDEIDFGEWSGHTFAELETDARWRAWNSRRSEHATPAGETMQAVYARAIAHMQLLANSHAECTNVLVTHADVIRAIVLIGLGASVDAFWKLSISPASITRLTLEDGIVKFDGVNECPEEWSEQSHGECIPV
ncbi:MAG TPA: histidine phosphatase family protein [Steroidobacteraceae bacterium]|nr:histidine phosphatase family protein [Steroidobacteraceae bacterium]